MAKKLFPDGTEVVPFYVRAIRSDPMVFVSGTTSLDSKGRVQGKDAGEQTTITMRKIEAALRKAGCKLSDLTQLTIRARTDAQVRSAHRYRNYGQASTLRVRSGSSRVYVKFDVTGISARPQSAKLRFWVTNGGPSGGTVRRVSSSWKESTITWHNAPSLSSSPIASYGAVSAGHWVEVEVRSAFSKNGTVSFAISGGSSNIVDYASTETSHDPVLVITP